MFTVPSGQHHSLVLRILTLELCVLYLGCNQNHQIDQIEGTGRLQGVKEIGVKEIGVG
jgi:hypothetical protein